MNIDPIKVEFATTLFIRECIRQYVRLHPKAKLEDMPIKALCEYSPRDQAALMAAVKVAIEAGTGMNDQFRTFLEQKIALAQAQAAQSHPTS